MEEEGSKNPGTAQANETLLQLTAAGHNRREGPLVHLQGGVTTSRTKQSTKVAGSQRFCCLKHLQMNIHHIHGDTFEPRPLEGGHWF